MLAGVAILGSQLPSSENGLMSIPLHRPPRQRVFVANSREMRYPFSQDKLLEVPLLRPLFSHLFVFRVLNLSP